MRMKSLIKVQLLQARRNSTLMILPLVIVILASIYAMMSRGGPNTFYVSATLVMAAYMIGYQLPVSAIAETKEKRTLEAVLLTPATPLEVIGAEAIVAAFVSVATGLVVLGVFGTAPPKPTLLAAGFVLALLLAISLGTLIGLTAKDQRSAGVLSGPVQIGLMLFTVMPWPDFAPAVWEIMRWLPTRPVMELIMAANGFEAETPAWQSILVMLPYVAAAMAAAVRQVRRQAADR